jgi:hypothetical protein
VGDYELVGLVRSRSGPSERRLALPYPAATLWISEQIATWLTLGRVPALAHDGLLRGDVAQGDEWPAPDRERDGPILAHYFTSGEARFFAHLAGTGQAST